MQPKTLGFLRSFSGVCEFLPFLATYLNEAGFFFFLNTYFNRFQQIEWMQKHLWESSCLNTKPNSKDLQKWKARPLFSFSAFATANNRTSIWSSNSSSGYIPQRTENRGSERNLDAYVYSSILHNSQMAQATQVCGDGTRINKMWSKHTTEYYSAKTKKEGNVDICSTWKTLETLC